MPFAGQPMRDFVHRLASSDPTPGGGSAAAVAGALAAALVSMVAELSAGRPRYAPFASTIERARGDGRRLADTLLMLADRDAAAFAAFLQVARMPRETEAQAEARSQAIRRAAQQATEAPRELLLACREIAELAERLAGRSNLGLASDLVVASRLAEATAQGAVENILVNLPALGDPAGAELQAADAQRMLASVLALAHAARVQVARRSLREPERGAAPVVVATEQPAAARAAR